MKPAWLLLLGAFVALTGIASLTDVADAQIRCGKFGCYTPSQASQYGYRTQSQRAAPIRRAAPERRANWRAAARERQRAARSAERVRAVRRTATPAVQQPQVAAPAAAIATDAAGAAIAGIPVTELDVTKVPALNRDGVRRVQQALRDKGFDPGPLNGVNGPRLKDAVGAFQARYGIASNGEVDNQTLLALGQAELASQSNR